MFAKAFKAFPKKVDPQFHDFTTPVSIAKKARRLPLKRPGAPFTVDPISIVCKNDFDFAEGGELIILFQFMS